MNSIFTLRLHSVPTFFKIDNHLVGRHVDFFVPGKKGRRRKGIECVASLLKNEVERGCSKKKHGAGQWSGGY
jgi:hypothetical protein